MSSSVAVGLTVREESSRGYRVVALLNSAIPCDKPAYVCESADTWEDRICENTTGMTTALTIATMASAMSISASVNPRRVFEPDLRGLMSRGRRSPRRNGIRRLLELRWWDC